jgi:hypothetical protein
MERTVLVRSSATSNFWTKKPSVLHRGLEADRSLFLLINAQIGGTWRGQAPRIIGGVEARACPLQQLQKTQGGWGVSVSTVRVGCDASGLERCDRRHKSNFRYPIIFWTTPEV